MDVHFEGPTGAPNDASYHPGRCGHCVGRQRLHRHLRPDPPPGGPELRRGRRALLRGAELRRALCPGQGARSRVRPPAQVPRRHPGHRRGVRRGSHRGRSGGLPSAGEPRACSRRSPSSTSTRGKGIPEGKKSVAFNLVLRSDDRSLTAEEADADVQSILALLEEELGATLR